MYKKLVVSFFALTFTLFLFTDSVSAQITSNFYSSGTVIEIKNEISQENPELTNKIIKVRLNNQSKEIISVSDLNRPEFQDNTFSVGDKVMVDKIDIPGGEPIFAVTDYDRTIPLIALTIFFCILVIVITKGKGVMSLIGLFFSFLIITQFMLKRMLGGADPLLISILAASIITPITYYMSHGLNKKTTYAILSTIITMVIIGIISIVFVDWAKLSGFTTDEAGFLRNLTGNAISIKDLLLAGIIVGILGILDDITISQSSIANQLKLVNPKIKFRELFYRTMEVGKDHITSLVNTLVLVYTSAALPLLLLIISSDASFYELMNREVLAEEIIRTLLTSSGLIMAVPISTFVSAYFTDKYGAVDSVGEEDHNHHGHVH